MARISTSTSSQQPELLARSGFQPYRPDERLAHPAGAYPMETYPSVVPMPLTGIIIFQPIILI